VTYAELRTKVADYLDRTDISASVIGSFIQIAQRKLERNNDWRCMQIEASLSSADAYLDLPSNFKDAISLRYISDSNHYFIERTSYRDAIERYRNITTAASAPAIYAVNYATDEMLVRPTPDVSYAYRLVYYGYTDTLINDADTNWWTTDAWEALIYGALLESVVYLGQDVRAIVWQTMYEKTIIELKTEQAQERQSDAPALIRGNPDLGNIAYY